MPSNAPARSVSHPTRAGRRRGRQREGARPSSTSAAACSNAEECVGEIVNTQGVGPFEGYYNNDDANDEDDALRLVLVGRPRLQGRRRLPLLRGRNADWIRVDGENFPAGPIEEALRKRARRRARRGLRRPRRPGRRPGDGRPRARRRRDVRSAAFAAWLDAQDDDRPEVAAPVRARPARSADDRHEQDREAHARAPEVPPRPRRRRSAVRPRTAASRSTGRSPTPTRPRCRESFVHYGRERFWDL